ncbi:DNA-3-methyladenine glycosylase I [Lactobacillus gigeriorum]|uniref:DNA-3-methyladenine glycosidase n=3 Tax=Lactobacillus TaxID=1578 RepID=A0ABR5PTV8_9LACO|nr:DNA-3-methyladenine glycosylase I [Lactobacillus gigeriorum]KRN09921.1 DNA-3-methyladenine glycosidase [Lactobacillus gigeriorum DSM 23908 = CRBIP 24.85]
MSTKIHNFANLRCPWGQTRSELLQNFHDHEWGKITLNDRYLYEMLVLQLFQSGLNWPVVLNKRENLRKAFKDFDPRAVAKFSASDVERLMNDQTIIRNRSKIEAAIKNARAILTVERNYGSFVKFIQETIPVQVVHHPEIFEDVPTSSDLSKQLARRMKKYDFFMVGPVIVYSYLQTIGLINDHVDCCPFKFEG